MRKLATILLICLPLLSLRAQEPEKEVLNGAKVMKDSQEDRLRYELALGVNFNTLGGLFGGIMGRYSYYNSETHFQTATLEIVNIKHTKEDRFQNGNGAVYIPGKLNYLFSIRPQYGHQWKLLNKDEEDGVRLSAFVAGGPSIGLLKPYYIKYPDTSEFGIGNQNYRYDPNIHNPNLIQGTSSIFLGFDELQVNWGANIKIGLDIEWARFESGLLGLEAGWIGEFYRKDLELSVSPNRSFLFNALFINLYFGSKY